MRNDNLNLGSDLAKYVNKKYGVITYSGTLAIELALLCLNLKPKSNVLISSEVCSSIINTINKLNLNPIILTTSDGITLKDEDIDSVINKTPISCIILVHQYGIFNRITKYKYRKMGIKIVEDIAQSWICDSQYYNVGSYSDIVVTSFGNTKPLNNGIGGAIFFDDETYIDKFDFCDNKSRESNNIIFSYLYPNSKDIKIKQLLKNSRNNIKQQKKFAKMYNYLLFSGDDINVLDEAKDYIDNSWHRFPIYFNNEKKFLKFLELAQKYKLEYQLQHKIKIIDLPSFKNNVKCDNLKGKRYYILLRTRGINYKKQRKKLKIILDSLEK